MLGFSDQAIPAFILHQDGALARQGLVYAMRCTFMLFLTAGLQRFLRVSAEGYLR